MDGSEIQKKDNNTNTEAKISIIDNIWEQVFKSTQSDVYDKLLINGFTDGNLHAPFKYDLKHHCIINALDTIQLELQDQMVHIINTIFNEKHPGEPLYSGDNIQTNKSTTESLRHFLNSRFETYISQSLKIEQRATAHSNNNKKTSYYCPSGYIPFVNMCYEFCIDRKAIQIEYKPYKPMHTHFDNNRKYTSNQSRKFSNYLKDLDYLSNNLVNYSSLSENKTKVLYYYRTEKLFGFNILEQLFLLYKNYIRDTLSNLLIEMANEPACQYKDMSIYDHEYWRMLSHFPNCFSISGWIPSLQFVGMKPTIIFLFYDIPAYETKFLDALKSHYNNDNNKLYTELSDYINQHYDTGEWAYIKKQIEKKTDNYNRTDEYIKKTNKIHDRKRYEFLNIHKSYIDAIKMTANEKKYLNHNTFKSHFLSEIEKYLVLRYSVSWDNRVCESFSVNEIS